MRVRGMTDARVTEQNDMRGEDAMPLQDFTMKQKRASKVTIACRGSFGPLKDGMRPGHAPQNGFWKTFFSFPKAEHRERPMKCQG